MRGVSLVFLALLVAAEIIETRDACAQTPGWTDVSSATRPTARAYTAMTFDSYRSRAILFGGSPSNGHFLGDTWEWDGATWTRTATSGPAARYFHAMAYDSAHSRTVLYGGADSRGVVLSDTWGWDGLTWTQIPVTGPGPLDSHVMAYDAARPE